MCLWKKLNRKKRQVYRIWKEGVAEENGWMTEQGGARGTDALPHSEEIKIVCLDTSLTSSLIYI
jgi:hypothetical protein